MPITFDGPNKVITLASGETQVSVKDVYSRWKDWAVLSDNAKYLPAFRTIGGDPLSAIINAGDYYFLRNDYGWRIKPPEEDITVYLSGNLAAEDSAIQAINPTDGAYTAAIIGLQPVTQGVTPVMASQLEFSSFQGGVWVDQTSGLSGTGYTSSNEPIGNAANPVDNFTDATTIALTRGLPRKIYVVGSATLTTGDDVSNFHLQGENAVRTMITIDAAAVTNNCEITEAFVTGNLDGGTIIRRSVIKNLNYINGFVFQCMIDSGTITLGGTSPAFFLDCFSGVPGTGTPVIDMNGVGDDQDTPLAMRNYAGGIKLIDKTGAGSVSLDFSSGQAIIDSTCVNGQIVTRGNSKCVDENGNQLETGTINGNLDLVNEAVYGNHLQEVWKLMGLDPQTDVDFTDSSVTAGSISQTISEAGGTTTVSRS